MLMVSLGAGSNAAMLLIFERNMSLCADSTLMKWGSVLLRHTLAKWSSLPQLLQGWPNAGHCVLPPGYSLPPGCWIAR